VTKKRRPIFKKRTSGRRKIVRTLVAVAVLTLLLGVGVGLVSS